MNFAAAGLAARDMAQRGSAMKPPRSGPEKKSRRFRCPHCGASLEKSDLDRLLNRSIDCPSCRGPIPRAAILAGAYDEEAARVPELVKYVLCFALGALVIWALGQC